MAQVTDHKISNQLAVAKHFVPKIVPSDQVVHSAACLIGQCQAEEGRKSKVLFESLHNRIVHSEMSSRCKSISLSH